MSDARILGLEDRGDGSFEARLQAFDGEVVRIFMMQDAEASSDGVLGEDEASARALIDFLLEHQDPSQLPEFVEAGDALAAYDDAVERLRQIRGA